jgi:hypothetical protein
MMVSVLIKSNQNKWVILGHELTENTARSATSRFSFAGSSFHFRKKKWMMP